jgi:hypothetical protein
MGRPPEGHHNAIHTDPARPTKPHTGESLNANRICLIFIDTFRTRVAEARRCRCMRGSDPNGRCHLDVGLGEEAQGHSGPESASQSPGRGVDSFLGDVVPFHGLRPSPGVGFFSFSESIGGPHATAVAGAEATLRTGS